MQHEGSNLQQAPSTIEALRVILEGEQSRSISLDEAAEIAESLLTFFEILGTPKEDEL